MAPPVVAAELPENVQFVKAKLGKPPAKTPPAPVETLLLKVQSVALTVVLPPPTSATPPVVALLLLNVLWTSVMTQPAPPGLTANAPAFVEQVLLVIEQSVSVTTSLLTVMAPPRVLADVFVRFMFDRLTGMLPGP